MGLGCSLWAYVVSRDLSWVLQEVTKYPWSSLEETGPCPQTSAAEFYSRFGLIPRDGAALSNQEWNYSSPRLLLLLFFFLEFQIWREKDISFRVRGGDKRRQSGSSLRRGGGTWGEILFHPSSTESLSIEDWLLEKWPPPRVPQLPCDTATSLSTENSEASKAQEESWFFYPLLRLRGNGGAEAEEKWKPQRAGRGCQSGKGKFICDVN